MTNSKDTRETDMCHNDLLRLEYWSVGVMQKTGNHLRAESITPSFSSYKKINKLVGNESLFG